MNEAERILVVFLSGALALFLVLAIIAVYKFIQFLDHLKTISEKAEKIADNAENISDFFRQAAGPALIGRLLAKISSNFYKSKKSNRRKHSDEDKKHTARNVALGGAVLAGASYLAGILTAPKAGRQTRKDIKNAATKAKREAEAKLKKAHSELNETIDEMSKKGVEFKGKAGEELKDALSKATTVKQKAREILSAIHEGEAQDKDLEVAINEVKKALKHLKTFAKRK